MKLSLNWLKEYIQIDHNPTELSAILTDTGLEVEGMEVIEPVKGGLKGVVIGEVLTCEKHPNADKLKVTTVDLGNGVVSPIVCGAPNVSAGQKVIVATVNSMLYPEKGEPFKIKKAKIRGEVSEGMICAEDEIGVGTSHDGIMVLDTELPNGTPAIEYFDFEEDVIFEIGITPNRADALSHLGATRDLKAVTGHEVNFPSIDTFSIDHTGNTIEVVIENSDACPRYSGITISNAEVKQSPDWLQTRLRAIGQTPINNVVDTTNFVLHELGQPMHAFDADQIIGNKVIVKTMSAGTLFTTLDEKERKLNAKDLMICNTEEGMCIAGVFGGVKSGVTENTKNIFLESAYFSTDYIRKTAQIHGLKTDASFRYERGTDPNITVFALKRAAILIRELTGGEISSEIIDNYPNPIEDVQIQMKYRNIDRLIGERLEKETIDRILNRLDIKTSNHDERGFLATVPAYRVDVTREADVIEEILRIYGYNNISLYDAYSSDFLSNFPVVDKDKTQLNIASMLAANGFYEIITNSLTKPGYAESMESTDSAQSIPMLNKLSEDLGVLRQSLLPNGLEVIAHNVNRRQTNLKFYEFGRSYHFEGDKYREKNHLDLFITGKNHRESWNDQSREVQYHDMYETVFKLLQKFAIHGYKVTPTENKDLSYGADISIGNKVIAILGKVSQKISSLVQVKEEVFYASLDWNYLLKKKNQSLKVEPVAKFPEVKRDLSLVVDKKVTYAEILVTSRKNGSRLLKDVHVFDVYEGDKIGPEQKAYALSFILQNPEKTMTDKLIDKTMNKLMAAFKDELGAVIRQ